MPQTINSAFDVLSGLTVDEALANPSFMPELVLESLDGEEFQNLLFRTVNSNSNVIAFREVLPDYLEDDVEHVAEFGEIPVSDPAGGELKTSMIRKLGLAIRVSWEQRNDNDIDAVQRELRARANTIVRRQAADAIAALNAADIQELAADVAWDQPGATPSTNILDAMELIQGAEDGDGHYFGFNPDVLLINPTTLTMLKRNDEVQKLYIGNMASENPLFKWVATEPVLFGSLQVAKSFAVPKGEAWLGVQGAAGFMAEREPAWVSDFYEERGNSGRGGANQSWRSDYTHRRAFGVDAPKSLVKLTGLVTG